MSAWFMADILVESYFQSVVGLPERPRTPMTNRDTPMKQMARLLCLTLGLCLWCGCDGTLPFPLLTDQVAVRLVNNADDDVNVTLYYDSDDSISESNLIDNGSSLEYTIEKDQSVSFVRDCDRIGAIIIHNATLDVLGGLGPTAGTRVLRAGDDFDCRQTLVFTFDGSVLSFDVTWDVP
jgi:hypothetical protein